MPRIVRNSFVESSIRAEETTVCTDAWSSYKNLSKLGIDHRPRKGGHGRPALDILPWGHTVFGNLETLRAAPSTASARSIFSATSTSSATASTAAWREGELFGFVLRRVLGGHPLRYRRLVAERAV
jgi:hypothetical protein